MQARKNLQDVKEELRFKALNLLCKAVAFAKFHNIVTCQVQLDTTVKQLFQEQDPPAPNYHQNSHLCSLIFETVGES